jgi:hypothetical protein
MTKQRLSAGMPQFPSYVAPAEENLFSHETALLGQQINYLAACGDGTCGPTASIMRVFAPVMLGTVGGGIDAGPNIGPRAIVEWLLLRVPTCQPYGWGNIAHNLTWHQRISALGYVSR